LALVCKRLFADCDEGNHADDGDTSELEEAGETRARAGESVTAEYRMKEVQIYTDGACRGNPGPGGWGVWLQSSGKEKELFGGESVTTNNRMELTAAIRGLSALNQRCAVILYTDSEYVKKGITEWIASWKQRDWKTAAKKPVKNVDLWHDLDELVTGQDVEWRWVKGHSGDLGNEKADELANRGIDEMLASGQQSFESEST
jgi:ribonuclease HI